MFGCISIGKQCFTHIHAPYAPGIYRAPNEGIRVIEKLAEGTGFFGKFYETLHYRRRFKFTPSRMEGSPGRY
jgi:hypothetical protein